MTTPSSEILTDADDGRTLDAHVGESIVLRLSENPTTGYRWSFDHLDATAVSAEEGEQVARSAAPGSGGERTWTLSPRISGTTLVTLKLWRQWQGDSSIQQRYSVTLVVKS